jgi:hypothetical protein
MFQTLERCDQLLVEQEVFLVLQELLLLQDLVGQEVLEALVI